MAHKDFSLAVSQHEAPTFSVAGREFKCLAEPPAGVLTDLIISADGSVSAAMSGIIGFLEGCLSDADAEAFRLLIHDKDTIIPLETLNEITEWLVEEYTSRPTTPPLRSQSGRSATPDTSEGGSSLPEPISQASGS